MAYPPWGLPFEFDWCADIEIVQFSGWRPDPVSTRAVGRLYAKDKQGNWFFSEAWLDKFEVDQSSDLINQKLIGAARDLNDQIEDPFDKYVREVRGDSTNNRNA